MMHQVEGLSFFSTTGGTMNRVVLSFLSGSLLISVSLACQQPKPSSKGQDAAPNTQQPTPTPEPKPEAPAPVENTPMEQIGARYKAQAEQLIAAIKTEKQDAEILKLAQELTRSGQQILPGLMTKYPECKAYLTAVDAVALKLQDLPLAEIERDYHKDAKLPQIPDAHCYHGKDLVVHPATVAAMAKKGIANAEERKSAQHEIVEVLAHLTVVAP